MAVKRLVKRAFTLIELLAVIAVIAILAAMLLPALRKSKAQSQSASCKNHLHQMGIALKMYVDDMNGRYPYLKYFTSTFENSVCWPEALKPYYPVAWTNSNYHCPGYKAIIKGPVTYQTDAGSFTDNSYLGSYGYNALGSWTGSFESPHLGLGEGFLYYYSNSIPVFPPAISESQLNCPSEMSAIGDSCMINVRSFPFYHGWVGSYMLQCGEFLGPDYFATPPRHGHNYNYLLCDGRVMAKDPGVMLNPTNSAPLWNIDHQPHPETWYP